MFFVVFVDLEIVRRLVLLEEFSPNFDHLDTFGGRFVSRDHYLLQGIPLEYLKLYLFHDDCRFFLALELNSRAYQSHRTQSSSLPDGLLTCPAMPAYTTTTTTTTSTSHPLQAKGKRTPITLLNPSRTSSRALSPVRCSPSPAPSTDDPPRGRRRFRSQDVLAAAKKTKTKDNSLWRDHHCRKHGHPRSTSSSTFRGRPRHRTPVLMESCPGDESGKEDCDDNTSPLLEVWGVKQPPRVICLPLRQARTTPGLPAWRWNLDDDLEENNNWEHHHRSLSPSRSRSPVSGPVSRKGMKEESSRRRRRRTRSREKMHDGCGNGLNVVGGVGILVRGGDGDTNVGGDGVEQDGW